MEYLVDPNHTRTWWEQVCNDEERLIIWLKKLYATELDGYHGNLEAAINFSTYATNKAADVVLRNTAEDERRHAQMLADLLAERAHFLVSPKVTSVFWAELEQEVTNVKSFAAMSYFGERLAAERFEIILDCKCTPSDVREFVLSALPDESYHKNSYRRLAGPDAIEAMRPKFETTLSKIIRK